MSRELRNGDVHAEADAEVRDAALACDATRKDLPFPTARAETARNEHAVDAVELAEGTRTRDVYGGEPVISERHRHRYEVNNAYRKSLVDAGLVVSGTFQEGRLVEVVELPEHPWFVASQFHPEFKSRPTRPAPLFREFVGAALERARERSREVAVSATS